MKMHGAEHINNLIVRAHSRPGFPYPYVKVDAEMFLALYQVGTRKLTFGLADGEE
jgi:hypothetical protein